MLQKWLKQIIVISMVICCLISGCTVKDESPKFEISFFAMNTYMTFTVYGNNGETVCKAAKKKVQELEYLWSVTDPTSEIYAINHSDGKKTKISQETKDILSFTLEMANQTNGALDPTIYPILCAWGFTIDKKQVPDQKLIDELLGLVDYKKIKLDKNYVTIFNGAELDLGATGKGYTADLIVEIMKEQEIHSALFSLGGNIQTIGSRPDGSNWQIGIRNPQGQGNLGILEISDVAVVTSGGYENYFEQDNRIYCHIIDPTSGYPVNNGLQAVTIIGQTGRLCDALSTALFVMGQDKAEAYWRKFGGFEMILITDQNEIF